MCIPIGIEWKCKCSWSSWIPCGDPTCDIPRYNSRPPLAKSDPHEGKPLALFVGWARRRQAFLKPNWCCGTQCCQNKLQHWHVQDNRGKYCQEYDEHLSECLPAFLDGFGKLNSMRNELGEVNSLDAPLNIAPNMLVGDSLKDPDHSRADIINQYFQSYNSVPSRGLQAQQFNARPTVTQFLLFREYLLRDPLSKIVASFKPPQTLVDDFRNTAAQQPPGSKQVLWVGLGNQYLDVQNGAIHVRQIWGAVPPAPPPRNSYVLPSLGPVPVQQTGAPTVASAFGSSQFLASAMQGLSTSAGQQGGVSAFAAPPGLPTAQQPNQQGAISAFAGPPGPPNQQQPSQQGGFGTHPPQLGLMNQQQPNQQHAKNRITFQGVVDVCNSIEQKAKGLPDIPDQAPHPYLGDIHGPKAEYASRNLELKSMAASLNQQRHALTQQADVVNTWSEQEKETVKTRMRMARQELIEKLNAMCSGYENYKRSVEFFQMSEDEQWAVLYAPDSQITKLIEELKAEGLLETFNRDSPGGGDRGRAQTPRRQNTDNGSRGSSVAGSDTRVRQSSKAPSEALSDELYTGTPRPSRVASPDSNAAPATHPAADTSKRHRTESPAPQSISNKRVSGGPAPLPRGSSSSSDRGKGSGGRGGNIPRGSARGHK